MDIFSALQPPPQGYIDPNSGGMIFQVLAFALAFLSGMGLFFARQIRSAFARLRRRLRGDREEPPASPPET